MPWRHTFLTTRSFGPSALTQVLHFIYNRALSPSGLPPSTRCHPALCLPLSREVQGRIFAWDFITYRHGRSFNYKPFRHSPPPKKKLHFLHSYTTRRNILTATVDAEARTLTVDIKDDWGGYYTFAHVSDSTVNVVATVDDDGTVTFTDWTAWYIPYAYAYIYEGAVSVLVRKP